MERQAFNAKFETIVKKIAYEILNPINPESTLEQIGLDSLDAVELEIQIEKDFMITVPNETICKEYTYKEVEDRIFNLVDNQL